MHHPSGGLCMTNQGYAQAGNVQRSGIVSGPTPETCGVRAAEPRSPVNDFAPMLWRSVGIGGLVATGSDMCTLSGLVAFHAEPSKKNIFAPHFVPRPAPLA